MIAYLCLMFLGREKRSMRVSEVRRVEEGNVQSRTWVPCDRAARISCCAIKESG